MSPGQIFLYLTIAELLYSKLLRGLLKASINDPDTDADEKVLAICDKVFGHKEDK